MATAKPVTPVRDIAAEQDRILSVLHRAVEGISEAIVAVETRDDNAIFNAAMTWKMATAELTSLYSLVRSSRTSFGTGRPVKS